MAISPWLRPLLFASCVALSTTAQERPLELPETPGRYVVQLHRQVVPAGQDENGHISYKSVYFGSVTLGGPERQPFAVVFDTGSGHVVVPSRACKSTTCKMHQRYARKESRSAVDVDIDGTPVTPGEPRDQITVAYGTGEITGQFVSDHLCMRHFKDSASEGTTETCTAVRIVAASKMTQDPFESFAFDGILGLGMANLAIAPEFSFFEEMTKRGNLDSAVFGVFLADNELEQSEISFGGYDSARVQRPPVWNSVAHTDLGHWQVAVHRLRVGDRVLDYCSDGSCRACVDTGTSVLAVPENFADSLYDHLTENLVDPPLGTKHDECRGASGDTLYFELAGITLELTPDEYAKPAVHFDDEGNSENSASDAAEEKTTSPRCFPALMPMDFPEPLGPKLFIWGEPMLRKYYTVYDWRNKRVGFSRAVHAQQEDEEDEPPLKLRGRPLL